MENTKIYNHELMNFDERHVVYLKEFIIYEQTQTKDKFVIFKFFNNYIEELNDVEFLIKQYDEDKVLIAETTLKYSNFKANKKSEFSPYTKLMVEDECHRIEAVLIKATFKSHHFEDNTLTTLTISSFNFSFELLPLITSTPFDSNCVIDAKLLVPKVPYKEFTTPARISPM